MLSLSWSEPFSFTYWQASYLHHPQKKTAYEIDENGTLKATEHDKYEYIAGLVLLSLFMGSYKNPYYCPRRLAPGWAQLNIYTSKQYEFDPSQTMETCVRPKYWCLNVNKAQKDISDT
jgi:hypothetical protein